MQVTARALGVQLQRLEVREPDDYSDSRREIKPNKHRALRIVFS
jgi:hypothetical protein